MQVKSPNPTGLPLVVLAICWCSWRWGDTQLRYNVCSAHWNKPTASQASNELLHLVLAAGVHHGFEPMDGLPSIAAADQFQTISNAVIGAWYQTPAIAWRLGDKGNDAWWVTLVAQSIVYWTLLACRQCGLTFSCAASLQPYDAAYYDTDPLLLVVLP